MPKIRYFEDHAVIRLSNRFEQELGPILAREHGCGEDCIQTYHIGPINAWEAISLARLIDEASSRLQNLVCKDPYKLGKVVVYHGPPLVSLREAVETNNPFLKKETRSSRRSFLVFFEHLRIWP